jgi:hypothetical protein
MELRVVALILSLLALAAVEARDTGFGSRDMSVAFQQPAFVDQSDHEATRGLFSPLALPTGRSFESGGAKFVRSR